jgi:excinuclease ABC subunit C
LKEGDIAYINYLMVRNGAIVQTHTIELNPQLDETEEEVLSFGVAQVRSTFQSDATEIVVPISITDVEPGIIITVSKGGDKRRLLDLSYKNVSLFKEEIRRKKMLHLEDKSRKEADDVLVQMQEDLSLPDLPIHIECFDNSNLHGSYPVSAMVCFKDGKPSKDDYRKFNVKTVQGINDFATMKEVVFRRYKRLRDGNLPFPQLVIIDGGKGQLSSAMEAIEQLELDGQMTVIGIAKNEEEVFFPGDSEPVKLEYNGDTLKLIRRIRDEVHRFGITFHRQQRSRGTFKNELETIPGIGKATATILLKQFKSVKNVKAADPTDLIKAIGKSKATVVQNFFASQSDNVGLN